VGFERLAEQKIRKAISEGKFEDLSNAGRPLDLESYFETPADCRLAHSILKNANCLPEEVELLNEIAQLERALAGADPALRTSEANRLRACRLRLAVLLEQARRSR
jgi:hypothetical protein